MNRAVAAGVAALVAVALTAWFLQRPASDPVVERAVTVAPVPTRAGPEPDVLAPRPEPEPEEEVDDRPDTAIPLGAEWGIPPMNDADHEVQEAAIDAELALPGPIMERWGEWDGFMMVPDRIARIESMLGRPVDKATILALTEAHARQSEESALTVGEFRLGRISEAESVQALDASRAAFKGEAQQRLGLSDSQFDEVFGLGSL